MSPVIPILYRTWDWCTPRGGLDDREHIVLWHGCTGIDLMQIVANGIDPLVCRPDADFGRGFYATTIERQARQWAWHRYYSLPLSQRGFGATPMVLRFRVRRDDLAKLDALHFVLGDYGNEAFWSLVHHCRKSTATQIHNHRCNHDIGPSRAGWYDIVSGPVAAFWTQRVAMQGADQIGFHTVDAASVLNALIAVRPRNRDIFRAEAV